MKRKPTALGVDIFAGLFTCGVKQAGFEVLGHLEHGNYGVKSALANYPKLDIRVGYDNWEPERFKGKVDFIYPFGWEPPDIDAVLDREAEWFGAKNEKI